MPQITVRETPTRIDDLQSVKIPDGFSSVWEFAVQGHLPKHNLMRSLVSNITVMIIAGSGKITWFDENRHKVLLIKEGQTVDIPKNECFRFTNGDGGGESIHLHIVIISTEAKPLRLEKVRID